MDEHLRSLCSFHGTGHPNPCQPAVQQGIISLLGTTQMYVQNDNHHRDVNFEGAIELVILVEQKMASTCVRAALRAAAATISKDT
jgi:hypothetical protein